MNNNTNQDQRMNEGIVCSLLEALDPDEEVLLNDRSRPLTVLGYEEDRGGVVSGSDYPYHVLWLRGNGTEYRLRWSHTGRYYPNLNPEGQLETTESYSIKHGEPRPFTRATTRGETVRRVRIPDVDDEDLSSWALDRLVGEEPTTGHS